MWVWTKLTGAKWMDAWEDRFRGDPNFVINLLRGGRSLRVERYCQSREEAEEIVERFGGGVRTVKKAEWAKPMVVPPVKIRDRLVLTAETDARALEKLGRQFPGRELLSIPAEMAFGTGDHATTATCLRMLVDIARERGWRGGARKSGQRQECRCSERVADLGTGSGVLAVAARRLGSGPVWACDFDPFAVEVARRNVGRNGLDGIEVVEADVLKWRSRKRFDLVLANLFSSVLIEAMPVIARMLAPAGELVLSGILREQAWEVFENAARQGLGFVEVKRRGKWVSARGGWMAELAG